MQLARTQLASGDPVEKCLALGAAYRLDILDEDLLQTSLSDPDERVRRRALELAPRLARRWADEARRLDLVAMVLPLLDDGACAETAAFALGELGPGCLSSDADDEPDEADGADEADEADGSGDGPEDRAVVAALARQAADHDDVLARESAVAALGSLGRGRPAVLAALNDVATVRRRAVIALAAFSGPEVDDALERARHDRDRQVSQAAEDLLALSSPDGEA